MHLRRVVAPEDANVALVQIVVASRWLVDTVGTQEPCDGRGHTQAGVWVDVVVGKSTLHELLRGVALGDGEEHVRRVERVEDADVRREGHLASPPAARVVAARAHVEGAFTAEELGLAFRNVALPLEGLPGGATALRLRTNQEVYFDRIEITGNTFIDNWNGVTLWENADRFCGSPANTSGGT